MKRYGDNLPDSNLEEFENQNSLKVQFMNTGCAVRQDMVEFLTPARISDEPKSRNIFSFFKLWKKKDDSDLYQAKS